MNNEKELTDDEIKFQEADSVIKIMFAIMNEEDDIDAYYDKTPQEMTDIIKLCSARYPEKKMASYDPLFTKFGQIFLNGYNTFGIDFIKLVLKRTDDVPNLCYKGLIDIYNNLLIENQQLALMALPEEERKKVMESLAESKEMSDEELLEKLSQEIPKNS